MILTQNYLYDKQIERLQTCQNNLLKIEENQTSILKSTANTFKEAHQMESQINGLISILYNQKATTVTIINLDIVKAKNNINEQINIFNLLFQ